MAQSRPSIHLATSPDNLHSSLQLWNNDFEKTDTHDPGRPQDRLGLLPDALFSHRSENRSRRMGKQRRMDLFWSYLPDWLFIAAMLIAFGFIDRIHGFHREFDINDPSIQFTHVLHERIPMPVLVVLVMAAPAILITLCSQLLMGSSWDTHAGLLGLALSLVLSLATTACIKVTVGRPRPDMLARCKPSVDALNAPAPLYGLSNSSICTAPTSSSVFQDGFRSFPSGHSSSAWAGLGFFALYLAGKLHLFDRRGHAIKVWVSLAPVLGATMIAVSRTMDYRHHWHDVLAGSLLGIATAWISYRLYYPSLSSAESHKPYSPRVPAINAGSASSPVAHPPPHSHEPDVQLERSPPPRHGRASREHAGAAEPNHNHHALQGGLRAKEPHLERV